MDTYTLLYFNMDTQQGPTVRPWNSAQWYVVAWTAGGSLGGRMDTDICMSESLCCSAETIAILFISCTPK